MKKFSKIILGPNLFWQEDEVEINGLMFAKVVTKLNKTLGLTSLY